MFNYNSSSTASNRTLSRGDDHAPSTSYLPPVLPSPRPATRMKRVFARRGSTPNKLQEERAQQTFSDSPSQTGLNENVDSRPPASTSRSMGGTETLYGQDGYADNSANSISTGSTGSISKSERPVLPPRKPLLHMIPSTLFQNSSSSLSGKRSKSTDSVDIPVGSPPPPLPPKPSRLRVFSAKQSQSLGSRAAISPLSGPDDSDFVLLDHQGEGSTSDYISSPDFHFPSKSAVESRLPPLPPPPMTPTIIERPESEQFGGGSSIGLSTNLKPNGFSSSNSSTADETALHQPPSFLRDSKNPRSAMNQHKRRSTSLSEIAATLPTPGSSFGVQFPPSRSKSPPLKTAADGDAVLPRGHTKGRIAAWSTAGRSPPPSSASSSSLSASQAIPAHLNGSLGQQHARGSTNQDTERSNRSKAAVPPRHPGASASLSIPLTSNDRAGRSSSPFRETARTAAAAGEIVARGGMLLGRRGWDRVERFWNTSSNSTGQPSSSTGFGGPGRNSGEVAGSYGSSTSDASGFIGSSAGGIRIPGCVRPARTTGGLLFRRSLRDATLDTLIDTAVAKKEAWVDVNGNLRGEMCPAIVVRCVQHLEKWGMEEEGLFRLSGRSTQTAKLKAEFDGGADYDLRKASPGDLDPHCVSSLFKAFLREIPEPLLTHKLMRAFDEVITNNFGDLGLSSSSTPNFNLIRELQQLIASLPPENRSVLRELCRLLRSTSEHHLTTKMPLSNLVLIFCPTLTMNPSLLRMLVETQEDIFEAPSVTADLAVELAVPEPKGLEAPLLVHQPSASDIKLTRLMATAGDKTRNGLQHSPASSLPPIVVPISVSATTPSNSPFSISSPFTLSEESFGKPEPHDSSSTRTWKPSLSSPSATILSSISQSPIRPKHTHNASLPLLSSGLTPSQRSPARTLGSKTDAYDTTSPRPRTQSTLRTLGQLLTVRRRSSTSPMREEFAEHPYSAPATPGNVISRRSSSFFPLSPTQNERWGEFSGGSLGRRKGSITPSMTLASPQLSSSEDLQDRGSPGLKLNVPHLSLAIPGGGTGAFFSLTPPHSSLTGNDAKRQSYKRVSIGGASNTSSSKRRSATFQPNRASWGEPVPALVDNTPAIGKSSYSTGESVESVQSSLAPARLRAATAAASISHELSPNGARFATPIADLFRVNGAGSSIMSPVGGGQSPLSAVTITPTTRLRADTAPLPLSSAASPRSDALRSRPLPTPPPVTPSTPSSVALQSAMMALSQASQFVPIPSPGHSSTSPIAAPSMSIPITLPLQVPGRKMSVPPHFLPAQFASAPLPIDSSVALYTAQRQRSPPPSGSGPPPTSFGFELSLPANVRSKRWSRTIIPGTAVQEMGTSAATTIQSPPSTTDDWATSVFNAAAARAADAEAASESDSAPLVTSTTPAALEEVADEMPIPDGLVRDTRQIFEAGLSTTTPKPA